MNCRDFDEILFELANDRMTDELGPRETLEHVRFCSGCAARLAEELALSAQLRALAAADLERAAPDRVETDLRAAFRGRHEARPLWGYWPAMAATAACATLVLILTFMLPRDLKSPGPGRNVPATAPMAGSERAGLSPADSAAMQAAPWGEESGIIGLLAGMQDVQDMEKDFIPLPFAESLRPPDSGQIVEVLLPESVFRQSGILTGELLKAEVLLGQDGIARSIRLIE